MSNPYVGEIRMFAGNFAPQGWMLCQGQLLAISDNDTLFNLIGTTYGGDGQNTFALPNLQSRIPMHQGGGFTLAETAGEETVTLNGNLIPAHTHVPTCLAATGNQNSPGNGVWAAAGAALLYANATGGVTMSPACMGNSGGSQPHDNMVPYLVINFIISLFGIFPSQT